MFIKLIISLSIAVCFPFCILALKRPTVTRMSDEDNISEPAGRSSIGYTRDFCFYYGPDIIHHIPIQNQWRRPQNYPECQPSGAAILNAKNQYWCRKILQKRFSED